MAQPERNNLGSREAALLRGFVSLMVLVTLLQGPPSMAAGGDELAEPGFRGVAVDDLAGDSWAMLDRCLSRGRQRALRRVKAVSLVERRDDTVVVDVLGFDPRFDDFRGRRGGLGVLRLEVVADGCEASARKALSQRSLASMTLSMRISIGDQTAVLEDASSDFRRVYPVGVGAVDRIRVPGQVTSLTPATEFTRLDRKKSRRSVETPRHYRGLPYIPLHVARVRSRPDGSLRYGYGRTRLAFHAHMGRRFTRGYTSRGCITMRDADLREVSDVLRAVETTLELAMRPQAFPDAAHPWPHQRDYYYELVNFGSAESPEYRVRGGLYVTEKRRGVPPSSMTIVGRFMDREAAAHVARATPGGAARALSSKAP